VIVNLSDIYLWDPAIGVDDGKQYFLGGDTSLVEKLLFKVLYAPGDVAGFSSLFVLPEQVPGVADKQELTSKLVY